MRNNPNHKSTKKHLSRDERVRIEEMLRRNDSIRSIAKILERSPSTILREIKNRTTRLPSNSNDCIHKGKCFRNDVCGKDTNCNHKCTRCIRCKKYCEDYTQALCERLQQAPYVCNGCNRASLSCSFEKYIYRGKTADNEYRSTLVNRRSGFDLTCEEIITINDLVSPLIRKGQSPFHIKQSLGDKLPVSEATIRRMIGNGELDVRNIDLLEQVKRKPRNTPGRKMHNEMINTAKLGRRYEDYLKFQELHDLPVVEMDCVEGTKEDNATLLTLHLKTFHLQLAFIMNYHTAACVVKTLNMIEEVLGKELFSKIFPLILTDNGHEFTDISGMEQSIYGGLRTNIFFCEPNRSDEKGACENNHKMIRRIIPKGTSLEPYCQSDITLMMNHINSYSRESLFAESPYSLAMDKLPQDFFVLLGLELISSAEIIMKPSLIRKKNILSE